METLETLRKYIPGLNNSVTIPQLSHLISLIVKSIHPTQYTAPALLHMMVVPTLLVIVMLLPDICTKPCSGIACEVILITVLFPMDDKAWGSEAHMQSSLLQHE